MANGNGLNPDQGLDLHKADVELLIGKIRRGDGLQYGDKRVEPADVLSKAKRRQEAINRICDELCILLESGETLESDTAKRLITALSKMDATANELSVAITDAKLRQEIETALMRFESAPMTRTTAERLILRIRRGDDFSFTAMDGAFTIRTEKK
jgi:hypothetical protein